MLTTTRFGFKFFLKVYGKWLKKWIFLSDLGKIKPGNEENRCILCLKRLTLGVWGHCGAQNMDFLPLKGAGQVTVTKEVWTYFTRQKPILVRHGLRPQRKTFLDIFWRVLIISWLYFASNRPETHILHHIQFKTAKWPLRSKFKLYFRAQVHSEPQNELRPKERRSGHRVHVISSFLGFILPKSDQKRTF